MIDIETAEPRRVLRIHVVGDTQRVMPIERLVLGKDTNDAGRSVLARELLSVPCDAIVHLGDLVGTVGSARDWTRFDRDYPPAALRTRRWLVCRGNHDCGGILMGSPTQFSSRYPESIAKLRVLDLDYVKLVLLDTNGAAVKQPLWEAQRAEFTAALRLADTDESVRHVLVFGHHPPLTNGSWQRPSRRVYDTFVEPFLACAKTRVFFSGHVHGYERFDLDGRVFVVSGGGGGPRVAHLHGAKQRYSAAIDLRDPHPLHYLQVHLSERQIQLTARGRDEKTGNWSELDSCHVRAE